jgi:hypothetical protein
MTSLIVAAAFSARRESIGTPVAHVPPDAGRSGDAAGEATIADGEAAADVAADGTSVADAPGAPDSAGVDGGTDGPAQALVATRAATAIRTAAGRNLVRAIAGGYSREARSVQLASAGISRRRSIRS